VNLLVTGGAGFIGSHFTDLALKLGHQVSVLDKLTYAANLENLSDAQTHKSYQFYQADINDPSTLEKIFATQSFDAVVHFAAETHVDRSITGPKNFIETNINGTFYLLEASLKHFQQNPNFRFLHISTDEVFGSLGSLGHFDSQSPYKPNSPYSASKAASDHLVRAWHKTYGLPVIITNSSNNFGPRQFPEKLIPLMIKNAIEGKPLGIYGDGQHVRDWIYVEDHCRGLMSALDHGMSGETYLFGGGTAQTNLDLVHALCDHLDQLRPQPDNYRKLIKFVEDRKGHDFRYAIDDSKTVHKLGPYRFSPFNEALRKTVKWYLASYQHMS
jgi:dTDP-glucose 4,6-dehydratase